MGQDAMIDCPFDDCLTFELPTKLADHIHAAHLVGRDPADELSIEQIELAILNLTTQIVTGIDILQLPRAHEVLHRARLDARPDAVIDLELIRRLLGDRELAEVSA